MRFLVFFFFFDHLTNNTLQYRVFSFGPGNILLRGSKTFGGKFCAIGFNVHNTDCLQIKIVNTQKVIT